MKENKIMISESCFLSVVTYENVTTSVSIDYTEHSPAYGYDDTETSVDIDKEKAVEIIDALKSAFELSGET